MTRKILSLKDPNWHTSRGRIIYDPARPGMKRRTKYWAIVNVDREITRYFRWWVDRELLNITVPTTGSFGQLREIKCQPDELFFATAQVGDIEIIPSNTPNSLRIR